MDTMNAEKQLEYAWAAGFVDGEGCIRVRTDYTLVLQVRQCNIEPINKFTVIFGMGKVHGSIPENPRHKPYWNWMCINQQAKDVLQIMLPYMVVKRQQALLAIHYAQLPSRRELKLGVSVDIDTQRNQLREQIQKFNAR